MISSRTPEGSPNRCSICGQDSRIEPSAFPVRDATCAHCGSRLVFEGPEQTSNEDKNATPDIIDQLVHSLSKAPNGQWQLDMSGVDSLSSSALGKLISLHRRVEKCGGRLALVNVAPAVAEVFAITRLNRLFCVR